MKNNSLKILLIEDEPLQAYLVIKMLKASEIDYQVKWVEQLSSGMEEVRTGEFDVILLDLCLPDSQGIDTLIKLTAGKPEAAIIVLTSLEEEAVNVQTVKEMAQDYLMKKQVDTNLLLRSVKYAVARRQTEKTLRLHSEIMKNMNEGVFLVRYSDGVVVYANPRVEKMFGYFPRQMHIRDMVKQSSGGNKSQEKKKDAIMAMLEERGEWKGEVEHTRMDGTRFWSQANLSLFDHPEYGQVIVIVFTDITERKNYEEQIKNSLKEKELLLREIHHRVKNNLQVISSMLRLQSRTIKDKAAIRLLEEGERRIKSIAFVHEKFYKSDNLIDINFSDYIRDLANNLFKSYDLDSRKISLILDVRDITTDIGSAVPYGLILNELISNAMKHAFPKNKLGQIRISLRTNEEGLTELKVSDNGIGFPENIDIRNTETLGLQLVSALVEEQLGGEIGLKVDRGTEFTMVFKNNSKER